MNILGLYSEMPKFTAIMDIIRLLWIIRIVWAVEGKRRHVSVKRARFEMSVTFYATWCWIMILIQLRWHFLNKAADISALQSCHIISVKGFRFPLSAPRTGALQLSVGINELEWLSFGQMKSPFASTHYKPFNQSKNLKGLFTKKCNSFIIYSPSCCSFISV